MFIIEFGVNHLGNRNYLDNFIEFYLKSSFKNATLMMHTQEFYKDKPNYKLTENEYKKILKLCKKEKKNLGLSVCDLKSFETVKNLKFDFYKLLSIANTDQSLIDELKKKNKNIYISTGLSDNERITKCVNYFSGYKKKILLHTPMTYNSKKLNFNKIFYLKKKYNLDVGYSNHNNNINTLYALSYYNPKTIFLYAKPKTNSKIKFPDDLHAFQINEFEKIKQNYIECLNSHKNNINNIKRVNIFK